MLSQLGISITATVAATLILAGAQYELTALRPTAAVPDLTSGGKFAARVEALRAAADDADQMVQAPPVPAVPLLAANNTLLTLPVPSVSFDAPVAPGAESIKTPKHAGRAEPRRRMPDVADIVRPRRGDAVVAAAEPPAVPAVQAEVPGVWSATRDVYKQALGIGGTMLDRINPMNLIP